ncbi:MAG: redox-regulated ATPase YchF, partial [bacterium]|nr:redox-regulated ATPase YchF [bacterium]
DKLAALEKSEKIVPTTIQFVDIAGLVKGAHEGAGLGNQFLSHIREVDAIAQVVRVFQDDNVIHVDGKIDPKRDIETIETELVLADLQMVEKKLENLKSTAKGGNKEDIARAQLAQKYFDALSAGKRASTVSLNEEDLKFAHEFPLLSKKPTLFVANVRGNADFRIQNAEFLTLDAQLESEIVQLPEEERQVYLKELGLAESGLDKLIKAAYKTLNLITFLTAGPKETRAWTIKAGTKAPQAAGVIHTDFERGFIKAEIINWQKLLEAGSWAKARDLGWIRLEGKDYVMADGDVTVFKFNV